MFTKPAKRVRLTLRDYEGSTPKGSLSLTVYAATAEQLLHEIQQKVLNPRAADRGERRRKVV